MPGLASKRCFHHGTREAVCRCPECRRFFCRECVVPFDGRLLCATCIAKATTAPADAEKRSPHIVQMALGTVALLVIWVVFYLFGWIVLQYRDTAPVTNSSAAMFYRA